MRTMFSPFKKKHSLGLCCFLLWVRYRPRWRPNIYFKELETAVSRVFSRIQDEIAEHENRETIVKTKVVCVHFRHKIITELSPPSKTKPFRYIFFVSLYVYLTYILMCKRYAMITKELRCSDTVYSFTNSQLSFLHPTVHLREIQSSSCRFNRQGEPEVK